MEIAGKTGCKNSLVGGDSTGQFIGVITLVRMISLPVTIA